MISQGKNNKPLMLINFHNKICIEKLQRKKENTLKKKENFLLPTKQN